MLQPCCGRVAAVLLTQVESAAVLSVSAVQRTPEHVTGLLVPRELEGSADQQPENTKDEQ